MTGIFANFIKMVARLWSGPVHIAHHGDSHPIIPIDKAITPHGRGKLWRAKLAAGSVDPEFHHISRQVRRRAQRQALKRMMKKGVSI
ncbi:MAG: hypothetical protein EP336_09445 [Rhodobacteraceae bacterium]|nr:MAG: hypothetical protein EP336_09445 [Paracoccaceae bacterium]